MSELHNDKVLVAMFSRQLAEFRGKFGRKGQVGGSSKTPTAGAVDLDVMDYRRFQSGLSRFNKKNGTDLKLVGGKSQSNGTYAATVSGDKDVVAAFLTEYYDADFVEGGDFEEFWVSKKGK